MMPLKGVPRFVLVVCLTTFLSASVYDSHGFGIHAERVEPSVRYIQSDIYGDFFFATGKAIHDSSSHTTLETDKECNCRITCLSNPNCMAVSSEVHGNGFLCKFSRLGPLETAIYDVNDKSATYIYRYDSLIGRKWGFQKDRLFYFELPNPMLFNEAKKSCEMIPGFRLPIIRTYDMMKVFDDPNVGKAYFLDLHKQPGGLLVWNNSTAFVEPDEVTMVFHEGSFSSDSSGPFSWPVFYFFRGSLRDQQLTHPERALCQANPLGVNW